MPSLLTLRPAARSWELEAAPHAYDEAGRAQFKSMPGVRWQPDATAPNGRGVWVGSDDALPRPAATLEAAKVVKVRWAPRVGGASSEAHTRQWPATWGALRDYQRRGAAWCVHTLEQSGAALLADEMGVGKTPQAIAACDAFPQGRNVLVVCPAIVVPHWREQALRFAIDPSRFHPYSYEGFQKALKQWGTMPASVTDLVVDELHYTSGARHSGGACPKGKGCCSLRARAVASWRGMMGEHVRVLGLTGTPMTARPRDLWHPLDLLWPGRWGAWWSFTHRYCDGHDEEIPHLDGQTQYVADGVSRADELAERLRACMLRRTKAEPEIARELPTRTRQVLEVTIPLKARRDLARAAAAIDWRAGGSVKGAGVSTLLSNVEGYKQEAAIALTQEVREGGGRVLLLTTRKATAAALGLALRAPVVDGDTPPERRRAAIADAPIAIATMYSVTTGIDLVGFDTVIFTGLDWVPSTLLQAEARVHRIGQRRPVTVWYLVGMGTLDEVVKERVIARLDAFEAIAGASSDGLATDLRGGSEEELLAAMVEAVAA